MSAQLFSNLFNLNQSTFISEDIGFLVSFFSLQKDLPQEKGIKHKVWLIIVFVTFISILDWIYFTSGVSIATAVICLPYFFFNLYHPLHLRLVEYRLRYIFNDLCTCLRENHSLLKKLLNLAYELQLIEKNYSLTYSNLSKVVETAFEVTVKLFNTLREETKQALALPATIEDINQEDNYISCLPIQLFEELLKEETPAVHQLKSLIQLVRIQQSEYLRRILCAHVSGTPAEKCQTLRRMINSLQHCKDNFSSEYTKLKSLYILYHSLSYGQNQAMVSSYPNSKSFDNNSSINSARLHLHAALLLLDNLERAYAENATVNHAGLLDDVTKIEKEISLGSDCLKVLSKKFFTKGTKESFKPIDTKSSDCQHEEKTVIIGENYQPTIEDQVFELFIDEDECLNYQYQDDIEETTIYKDDFAAISSSLFQELKTALIPKAEETREREAKALGVPIENVPIQLNIGKGNFSQNKIQQIPQAMRQNEFANVAVTNSSFTTALATRAAQISKDLKLNTEEECFGDIDDNFDHGISF